jgi:sphingomyelin phosphodiesterase acid-like 3
MRNVAPGLYVLLMNTVIYSPKHTPNATNLADPFQQFQWMRSMLDRVRAEGAAAYIAGVWVANHSQQSNK